MVLRVMMEEKIGRVARDLGVWEQTARKWVCRYPQQGEARSGGPRTLPKSHRNRPSQTGTRPFCQVKARKRGPRTRSLPAPAGRLLACWVA